MCRIMICVLGMLSKAFNIDFTPSAILMGNFFSIRFKSKLYEKQYQIFQLSESLACFACIAARLGQYKTKSTVTYT